VNMLWWFLILGASSVVVVSVAVVLYLRVRRQMKGPAADPHKAADDQTQPSSPREV